MVRERALLVSRERTRPRVGAVMDFIKSQPRAAVTKRRIGGEGRRKRALRVGSGPGLYKG
jgi:hypothetical protein